METAAGVIPARSTALFLIDEEAEEFDFEVALGPESDQVRGMRVPLGHGIAGLVAVSGQPMAVSDAGTDPRQAADIAKSVGYAPGTILCVPLFYNEEVVGVLELLDREGAETYNAHDMATLGLFANQAAVAIGQSGRGIRRARGRRCNPPAGAGAGASGRGDLTPGRTGGRSLPGHPAGFRGLSSLQAREL